RCVLSGTATPPAPPSALHLFGDDAGEIVAGAVPFVDLGAGGRIGYDLVQRVAAMIELVGNRSERAKTGNGYGVAVGPGGSCEEEGSEGQNKFSHRWLLFDAVKSHRNPA